MADYYWELFCVTGEPVFYLLYRRETQQHDTARTAWCPPQAQLL